MKKFIHNRLIVLGPGKLLERFLETRWLSTLHARYDDWLEKDPGRYICIFETIDSVMPRLRRLSRRWPGLIFLVDSEDEQNRIKSIGKAKAGQTERCSIGY